MYTVMISSMDDSENGLYFDNQQVASPWLLRKIGHDLVHIQHWTQASLARVARQAELYLKY